MSLRNGRTVDNGWLPGALVWVRSSGTSPDTFVLIHGIRVSSRYFRPLAAKPARTAAVRSIDLPAHGSSPKPRRTFSVPDYERAAPIRHVRAFSPRDANLPLRQPSARALTSSGSQPWDISAFSTTHTCSAPWTRTSEISKPQRRHEIMNAALQGDLAIHGRGGGSTMTIFVVRFFFSCRYTVGIVRAMAMATCEGGVCKFG